MSVDMRVVLGHVADERRRQDEKWGSQRANPDGTWGLVLGEEYGEVCEAALNHSFARREGDTLHLYEELIQVAAVAVAWAEALREEL